jgi:hypothetical protein
MKRQTTALVALLMLMISSARADWTGTKGMISIQADSFVSPDYTATSTRQYNYVSAGMKTAGLGPDNRFENMETGMQASIIGQFAPQEPVLSYLNIRQLYHQESQLSVGRKLENWSDVDERWNLGLFQPQFRWNPLRPESQGLSGIFFRFRGEPEQIPWGLLIFGSLINIPDQGAGYTVKEGRFEPVNPWFSPPPRHARFERTGAVDDINYEIQKPDTNRIIFNTSYAAQAFVGDAQKGWSAQTAFAYKPANQLTLGLDGDLTSSEIVNIRVNPTIFYHSLFSADLRYADDRWEAGVGGVREKPQDPESPSPEWTYQTYGESSMISPYVGVRLGQVKLRFMNLQMNKPSETAKGPKAEEIGGLLAQRYPFGSANAVEASTRFYWRRFEGIQAKARYTQSTDDEFSLVTGDLQYQIDSRWSVGGQILLVRADSDKSRKTVYSDYENNDSAQVGVLYVF